MMSRSSTATDDNAVTGARLPPLHPGEVLREEFLVPFGISPYRLAAAIGVPRTRIERIAREEIGLSADTSLRLARYFGTSPEFWFGLQARYERESAEREIGDALLSIAPLAREPA
jgi:addiction module HigA family antidote